MCDFYPAPRFSFDGFFSVGLVKLTVEEITRIIKIKQWILKTCQNLKLNVVEKEISIDHPANEDYGDYTTNIVLILAKKEKVNPIELARKINTELERTIESIDFIKKVESISGFVNFYLKDEYLIKEAEKINYEIEYGEELKKYGNNKKMLIDYSAPNIAKPFGIGHLRSTNIGQALYNLYKILGWECIGDNHLGDWGTQFGKLITAIEHWNKKKLEHLTIENLEELYVRFHKEAENDVNLIDEARSWFEKLEKGDKGAREIWQKCVDISMIEFNRVYELLGVKIDIANGESFYEDKLKDTIEEIIKKGIAKKSDGATIVELKGMSPAMLVKTDGTTTYFARDMATLKYRKEKWDPDLIIYEVGTDQDLHFRQVFETAKMMNWFPLAKMIHVGHGLIRWKDGKFSTRKGDTIHLSVIIDKAIEKAKELAKTKDNKIAQKVAIGAIKFSDLAQDPKRDIIFDWDRIMSLSGNSGPYLQYTYARCHSVLNKTDIVEQKNLLNLPQNISKEEKKLLREFYKFEEKILEAANRYSPSVVAEYLLRVARIYNEFYEKNRIIGEKEENFRIFLTKVTQSTLEIGLRLLGVEVLQKM